MPQDPLVPWGLRPLTSSQPPTFVFQPPTSKLVETPDYLRNFVQILSGEVNQSTSKYEFIIGLQVLKVSSLIASKLSFLN